MRGSGSRPSARPPTSNRIGYDTRIRPAIVTSAATTTSRPTRSVAASSQPPASTSLAVGDDVLLLFGIVPRDDSDDRLRRRRVLGIVRHARPNEEEVARLRLQRVLELRTPVVDRMAAQDVDGALEARMAVRLRLAPGRDDDEVER